MEVPQYQDKFIAFIDILGFSDFVTGSETGASISLQQLIAITQHLSSTHTRSRFEKDGPFLCPKSNYLNRNLDFRVLQISDCAIISSEISPAGIINLISHCWTSVLKLLHDGFLCRGYITRGNIYHSETQIIGTGYLRAFHNERGVEAFKREADERGTPFVEIDQIVCNYIANDTDQCVREMFSRQTETDGSFTALFPFKIFSHDFAITADFDPDKERRGVENMRGIIRDVKGRVEKNAPINNPLAIKKTRHYIDALDTQLHVCDRTDEMIQKLTEPFLRPL